MRIRMLKSIASIYGPFYPGMVADIPAPVAKSWCNAGIAEEDKSQKAAKTPRVKPEVIPSGMFWCTNCQVLHRADTKIGKRHLKYSG